MIRVEPIQSATLRRVSGSWAYADANRDRIDRHWAEATASNPKLWNGRTLICTRAQVEQGRFTAELVETDYASFVAWRDWRRPDETVVNCFGIPAAFSADGGLLLGVMAAWTLNAGMAYPPSGSLEPKDVRPDGTVDIFGNMRTELLEETGLDLRHAEPGSMAAIFEGPRLAIVQRYDFSVSFAEMEQRFIAHTVDDLHPELARIEPVWRGGAADHRMPPYVAELIRHFHR